MKRASGWLQKETEVMGLCILYLDKACGKVWVHIQHAGCTIQVAVICGDECVVLCCVVLGCVWGRCNSLGCSQQWTVSS